MFTHSIDNSVNSIGVIAPALQASHTHELEVTSTEPGLATPVSNISAAEVSTKLSSRSAELLAIEQTILEFAAEITGRQYGADEPFMATNVTSAQILQLAIAVQVEFEISFSPIQLFNHPTPSRLCDFIGSELGLVVPTPIPVAPEAFMDLSEQTRIGASGLQCRSPAVEATYSQTNTLWYSLSCGHDSVAPVLSPRFAAAALQDAVSSLYVQHGHFITGVQLFEPTLFGMSTAEVKATDPTHRVLLHTALSTFVCARQTPSMMEGSATGVFLGLCNVVDWPLVQKDAGNTVNVFAGHGSDGGAAAGRISYLFGLQGPCLTVNTACSSSIVALDTAWLNLQRKRGAAALVAGTCLHLHISSWQVFCALHALAPDGRCKTFDSRANGYTRAEACGAVLLTEIDKGTLTEVAGTAVNQDGRSASFMAPNGNPLTAALRLITHIYIRQHHSDN